MKKRFARWKKGKRIDDAIITISEKEYYKHLRKKSLGRLIGCSGPPVELDMDGVPLKRTARQKLTGRNYEELNIISKARPKGKKFKEYTLEELKILNDKRNELCQGGKTVAVKDLIKATNL